MEYFNPITEVEASRVKEIGTFFKDVSLVLKAVKDGSKKNFGPKLQGDFTLGFPFGFYPTLQIFFSRSETDELPNEGMILHELNVSIDTVTGEIDFDPIYSFGYTGGRGGFLLCLRISLFSTGFSKGGI